MRRGFIIAAAFALLLGALLYAKHEAIILDFMAARLPKTTLAERESLIRPSMQFLPPAGVAPPYPVVMQFHGCSGMRQNFMDQWAKVATGAGYMAVIVDSNGPRGIDRERGLSSVCEGKELIGQERAGDVLAAYEIVRQRTDVDASKIVLAGWSHGGWTIMDYLAMNPPRKFPGGVRRAAIEEPRIAGAILIYPYCGRGAWSRAAGNWPRPLPALALIAGDDHEVDPRECPKVIKTLNARGAKIDLHVFEGADHVFDDAFLAPRDQHLYNAEAHAEATALYREFLDKIAARQPRG
jgi:dienelactone hydrolase